MKKSEFEREFVARRYRDGKNPPGAIAAALAEEAGVQWEPEEAMLPADLRVRHNGPGAVIYGFVGAPWIDLSRVDEQYPLSAVEVDRLEALVRAANRLPELEALARDMADDLLAWEESYGSPETDLILDRARDMGLLPRA